METRATKRRQREADCVMDARLWGELQFYVDLKMIFAMLPIQDFFQLRVVCKEWNRLATDRAFLQESMSRRGPISSPYFIVKSAKRGGGPSRLLHRTSPSSSSWSLTRIPPSKCDVEGLLLCTSSQRVFNIHTRAFHSFPSFEGEAGDGDETRWPPFTSMVMAHESSSSFQLVIDDKHLGTHFYDSKCNLWTKKKSLSPKWRMKSLEVSIFSSQGSVILRDPGTKGPEGVSVYMYKANNEWLPFARNNRSERFVFSNYGAWRGQVYMVMLGGMCSGERSTRGIRIHESKSGPNNCWTHNTIYSPEGLFLWLVSGQDDNNACKIQCKSCAEYVLLYNCLGLDNLTKRALLYNLELKSWEKVEFA